MRNSGHRSLHVHLAAVVVCALAAAGCTESGADDTPTGGAGAGGSGGDSGVVVEAVSSRADTVTGDGMLVRVQATSVDEVTVDGALVDADVRPAARGAVPPGAEAGDWLAVRVTGLPEGPSTVEVATPEGTGSLEVVNHPRNGPVFLGEQLPMTVCTTENFGLEPAEPPGCEAPTTTTLAYLDAEGELVEVDDASQIPDEVVSVDLDGESVPVVVRVERGVLNRAVYEIVTLHDPETPLQGLDDELWNGRLVYRFGGGCGTTFGQGFNLMGAPDAELLARGYAFATSSLNTFQVQCNDLLSAETASVVKEHFSETLGVPEVTIGEGGSGGAIQQLLIAQNQPGILDAIGPALVFPDAASIAPGVVDCALLGAWYASPEGRGLDAEQQAAVNGHLSNQTCLFWEQTFVPAVDPTACGFGDAVQGNLLRSIPGLEDGLPVVPEEERYDPESNPDGVRCTFQDSNVAAFGRDPVTGFALRPLDNVGLQYGLAALNSGAIDTEEFLSLNEAIGGLDIDGNPVPERMVADPDAIEAAYATGRIVSGGGGLGEVPIISLNLYSDPTGDIHDRFRMFSLDERLRGDDGERAANHVMWTRPVPPEGSLVEQLAGATGTGASLTLVLDEWATAVRNDTSDDPVAQKLSRNRPDAAVNACFTATGEVEDSGDDVYERPGPCTDRYPMGGDPRTVAGAPLSNDIGKCQLQPVADAVAAGVYAIELGDAEVARLEAVFPDGVCDWTRPGVGQVPLRGVWLEY